MVGIWLRRVPTILLILLAGGLAGCSLLPSAQPAATLSPQATITSPAVPLPQPTPLPSEISEPGKISLMIWLPPEFDPEAGTPAGNLLAARLESFLSLHPDVEIRVRIKAKEGVGGLLDSLSTASAAAPLALPDLVALPRPLMEAAALKGLLRPFDDLTQIQLATDWYPYANELAHVQNSTFGLPFAGDALLVAYSPDSGPDAPFTWGETVTISGTLAFPASDPQALFPLSLYLAAGGAILDEQGRPALDPAALTRALDFLAQAEAGGSLPYWIMQHETLDQSWEAFDQGQVNQTLTWSSRILTRSDIRASLLPAPDATNLTLITGWVWALPGTQPNRQSLSAELAAHLVDSTFLVQWAAAAGYIPTRSAAIGAWSQPETSSLVEQIALVARPYPAADLLLALGPVLKQATLDVLTHQQTPQQAAEEATAELAVK